MFRVMSEQRYRSWCEAHSLDLSAATFHVETCYYGRGLRARPGAVFVLPGAITHFSYRWSDTLWAIGEPSVRLDIAVSDVVDFTRKQLSLVQRVIHLGPEGAFVIGTADKREHFFLLQRSANAFEAAVRRQLVARQEAG
jgi:hypothetical protein